MSDPMDFEWTIPQSPPFDISTFDPKTLSETFIETASLDPDLCLVDARPALEHATSRRDWVRRDTAVEVSPSVLALGKEPYPGLKVSHKVPPGYMTTVLDYNYSQPWFGDHIVLHYLTPARLLELGCINTDTTPVSNRFRIDPDVLAKANKSRLAPSYIGNHDGIHPILRRRNFNPTSDYEYECLKPTFRVVTKLLEMENALDLLWALGQRCTQVQGTKLKKDVYVYYTGQSTTQQRQETALELVQLAEYVQFSWGDTVSDGALAITENIVGKPGLRGGITSAGEVTIDDSFRYAIVDGSAVRANLYNPAATIESSFLRTQWWLATAIFHELGHVFRFNTSRLHIDVDPFCNDCRLAEEGFALTAAVLKGVIPTSIDANLKLVTSPFGMATWEWPGFFETIGLVHRRTAHEDGFNYANFDVIKMEYIRDFFSDEFWDQCYLRYGMSSFRAVGVRDRVFDENMAPNGKRVATIGLELEAEPWMPEVEEEGIVYEDRVLNFAGDKVIATKPKTAEQQMLADIAMSWIPENLKKLSAGMKAWIGRSPVKKKSPMKKKK
ncbi:hypothetical protein M436DRAFT_59945 [Aureobasidium namibiae CBS 147.97]|uniref:Uncharacterized protein n=1 Tax=Aureobasidium namibiae CBS 147.97 TaxID=1043004 RepID=A0A074WXT3_9PEZI